MKQPNRGVLYGVGVGPGDSRLLTIRATEVLKSVETVFVPQSSDKMTSLALDIARPYINANCRVVPLLFPMIIDRDLLEAHWRLAAEPVAAALRGGDDCAFLTLGDPMVFSTFIYLARAVRALLPDAGVESVPGITSAIAAASSAVMPLAEGDDAIAFITGERFADISRLIEDFQTIVIMKVGRRLSTIVAELRRLGLDDKAVVAHRIGLDGEVVADLANVDDSLGYLSTIIVRRPHE